MKKRQVDIKRKLITKVKFYNHNYNKKNNCKNKLGLIMRKLILLANKESNEFKEVKFIYGQSSNEQAKVRYLRLIFMYKILTKIHNRTKKIIRLQYKACRIKWKIILIVIFKVIQNSKKNLYKTNKELLENFLKEIMHKFHLRCQISQRSFSKVNFLIYIRKIRSLVH